MTDTMNFDLDAAAWRSSTANQQLFVKALANRLQNALPGSTSITYAFTFSKNKPLKNLSITLGDDTFNLDFHKSRGIQTRIGKRVRGIMLSTKQCAFPEWLQQLHTALNAMASQGTSTLNLLEDFILKE